MYYYIYEFNKSKMGVNQNNIKKTLQECLFFFEKYSIINFGEGNVRVYI
jgi:hypothetical protein